MNHQVVVSIAPVSILPQENQRQFPFSWISSSGENFADIIDGLKKHAVRDFIFSADEAERLGVEVLKAFNTHYKSVTIGFDQNLFLTIAILDEDEIKAREEEVFALMMSAMGAVDKSKLN